MTDRIVIGGTDCTDLIEAETVTAPPLSSATHDQLYLLLAPMREAIAADTTPIAAPKRTRRAA
jgi:hypothetical protein